MFHMKQLPDLHCSGLAAQVSAKNARRHRPPGVVDNHHRQAIQALTTTTSSVTDHALSGKKPFSAKGLRWMHPHMGSPPTRPTLTVCDCTRLYSTLQHGVGIHVSKQIASHKRRHAPLGGILLDILNSVFWRGCQYATLLNSKAHRQEIYEN